MAQPERNAGNEQGIEVNPGDRMLQIIGMLAEALKQQVTATTHMMQYIHGSMGEVPQVQLGESSELQKSKPSTFRGEANPIIADQWLKELDDLFEVLESNDAQKVEFATCMLVDEAEEWWSDTRQLVKAQGFPLTWDSFKIAFLGKFNPEYMRNEKDIEFLQLRQGTMPFEEFLAKFEELSKFSLRLRYRPDEAWKAMLLGAALNPTMQKIIVSSESITYATFVAKCRLVANCLEAAEKERQNISFTRKRPIDFSKDREGAGKKPMVENTAPIPCTHCGKNHEGKPCRFGLSVCYNCGKSGHRANKCPLKKKADEEKNPSSEQRIVTLKGKEVINSNDLA